MEIKSNLSLLAFRKFWKWKSRTELSFIVIFSGFLTGQKGEPPNVLRSLGKRLKIAFESLFYDIFRYKCWSRREN